MPKTPRELLNEYKNGLKAVKCDPEELKELLGELKMPLFGAGAYQLQKSGDGKLSLPFKSLLKYDPKFGPSESQESGDCVSHSTRNAIDVTRAVEIDIHGEAESFITRGATEAIYGARGWAGEGMTCSGATKFVHENGGIILRQNYPELGLDFSTYDVKKGIGWGRRGVPSSIANEAKNHQVKTASLITTVQEARDALSNGYAISVCSQQGFSSRRDKYGIAAAKGTWYHAMAWVASDDTREVYNETLFLVQNSWGKWNAGPKRHGQPDGSFWIREKVARKMLSAQGSWVYSNIDGFPAKDLPDYGTTSFL